ncbi:MAG: glycerate kinase [Lachnospiraceae bacterium]|nr:glycerate kinase [Lachnospiraceae bacterium]
MKLIFASDSFKGTISSEKTSELLDKAAHEVFGDCDTVSIPLADGGEGTTDAVISAVNGERVNAEVHDPLMRMRQAYFGKINDHTAIMEMAQASGLPLIPEEKRNPLNTTTFGTGELLKAVLDSGADDIFVAIGGSATNDGGMGFACALGAKFLDKNGNTLQGRGLDLEKAAHIDISGIDPRALRAKITVLCDVTNPLCGENGATLVFGKQKGGSPDILERLEKGMQNYRDVLIREFGQDPDIIPGSGAAGGLGAALRIFFNAEMKSGIEAVLDITDFDKKISGADYIITGEGQSDRSSVHGKVLCGVGEHGKKAGIPVIALCGSLGDGYEELYDHGISSFLTSVDAPMAPGEAFRRAEELYYKAAVRLFSLLRVRN